MAFLKVDKKKSGTYLRIVESYRIGNKVHKKELYHLGKLENFKPKELESIARRLLELIGQGSDFISQFQSMYNAGHYNYGYLLIVKRLLEIFGLEDFFKSILKHSRIRYNFMSILQLMISERLQAQGSKRGNYLRREDYFGKFAGVSLHQLYRSLDILNLHKDKIQRYLYERQQNLFSVDLRVVLYDVTTLYFESSMEDINSVRQKGYSKDGKATKVQLLLGLLTDVFGNGYGYRVYKGNVFEGHTLLEELKRLKEQYGCEKITIVGDNGMMSNNNLLKIEASGYEYILGQSVKRLPEDIKSYVLNKSHYHKLSIGFGDDKSEIDYCVYLRGKQTIICTYSEVRAKKDKEERDKLIEKAKDFINAPSKYTSKKHKGAGKYIKENGLIGYELDNDKISLESRYDGYKAIITNIEGVDVKYCIEQYRSLIEVEHAFRTLKSILEIRPIYLWTNEHIEGHICMSFISYVLIKRLRTELEKTGLKLSFNELLREIDNMQLTEIKYEGLENSSIYMPTKLTPKGKKILEYLKVKEFNNIESEENLKSHLIYQK